MQRAIIGIDFDGTCVTHAYPKVGQDIGAVPVLKRLVEAGHRLILFTMRSPKQGISPVTQQVEEGGLQDAVDWFKQNDIPLFGVNENPEQHTWTTSPKPYCHLYIDDAALGCPLIYHIWEGDRKPNPMPRPYVNWERVEYMLQDLGFLNAI